MKSIAVPMFEQAYNEEELRGDERVYVLFGNVCACCCLTHSSTNLRSQLGVVLGSTKSVHEGPKTDVGANLASILGQFWSHVDHIVAC